MKRFFHSTQCTVTLWVNRHQPLSILNSQFSISNFYQNNFLPQLLPSSPFASKEDCNVFAG